MRPILLSSPTLPLLVALIFPHSDPTPRSSPIPHSFPNRDMTDQPGSARFQMLLKSALRAYAKRAGVTLVDWKDSLAFQLQSCHSVDDIIILLHDKTQGFDDLRQCDRIFKSIKATVSILTPTSAVASVANDVDLVSQKTLMDTLTFLIIFTDITDIHHSWHPAGCMYHSQIHMLISC
jgi:hypothetical protein